MFETPLVPEQQHWILWAILLSLATFGMWAEKTNLEPF